jgi:putative Holliday junction resolvase
MKIIGIDYGEARIGIASSDDAGIMAHPEKTIRIAEDGSTADAISDVVALIEKKGAEVVVVGMPFQLDGDKGQAAETVESWVEQLTEQLPEVSIEIVDERLTTAAAKAKLKEAGKKTKKTKGIIDQVAAVEILQSYLDAQQESALNNIGKGGIDPDMAAFHIGDDDDGNDFDDLGFGGGGSWDVDGNRDDY